MTSHTQDDHLHRRYGKRHQPQIIWNDHVEHMIAHRSQRAFWNEQVEHLSCHDRRSCAVSGEAEPAIRRGAHSRHGLSDRSQDDRPIIHCCGPIQSSHTGEA